ncbi:MAG: FAD-dependent oxidoreductase [Planctomycetota bacterium]
MRSDPRELHWRGFDLVVIGAGIQGAAIARDASLRGLSVLLVEKRDVAAGTSSRSSRLVHGGLRYLRSGHVSLVREALAERELLLRLAPHLVRPQPMLMPFFRGGGLPRWQLRIGTWLYSKLAGRSTLPKPRRLSATDAVEAFPGLRTEGLRSALEFQDARTDDARLTLANVFGAVAAGCRFVNHVEVVSWDGQGVVLVDRIGTEQVEVRVHARKVVNAAGPAVDRVRRALGIDGEPLVRTTRGSHVVLPERAGELALAAFLPDKRIQFVVPHAGGTLCGTTDVDDPLEGNETGPPREDLKYLQEALGWLLDPAPQLRDMQFAYAGWRALPAVKGPAGGLNREAFLVDEQVSGGTVHTVVGGKLTTHRSFAERVVAKLFDLSAPSPTRTLALPGGDGPREVDDPLWWRHGSRVSALREFMRENPETAEPLCPHRPFLVAELVQAVRHEGAVRFADVMLRRLTHVMGPCLDSSCLLRAHLWYLRESPVLVDEDSHSAVAAVRREVAEMTGDLSPRTGERTES